jgi:hypothetical protein
MKKMLLMSLALFLIVSSLLSCTRTQGTTQGELAIEKLKSLNAIPIEYGSLVGVTANPEFSRWAQLWFEDEDHTIRVVSVGFFDQKIREEVTMIPRN